MILIFSLAISCGKGKITPEQKPADITTPISIIVDKIITGVSASSRFKEPYGLAIDINGNIYVADAGNDRVVKLNSKFEYQSEIGGFGRSAGLFSYPTYISFDNGLNLYVCDERNRRVAKFDSRLNFVDEIIFNDDADPLKFGYPSGVAVTSYGEVWIADRTNNQIMVFNNVGHFSSVLGDYGSSAGRLKAPEKLLNSSGRFILCDAGNNRIVTFDSYGNYSSEILPKATEYPISVIDKKDYFMILDGVAGTIHIVDQKGNQFNLLGPQLPGDKIPFKEPSDFILLDDDQLLIADTGNNRLVLCRLLFNKSGE